jgi:serine O-acetyltransferase
VKRHPTVESEATLGANSTLVGDITVGEAATVGAGAVVVDDVPADATAVGNPAELVEASGDRTDGDVALVGGSVPEGGEVAVDDAGTAGERATNGDTDDCDDRRFRLAC